MSRNFKNKRGGLLFRTATALLRSRQKRTPEKCFIGAMDLSSTLFFLHKRTCKSSVRSGNPCYPVSDGAVAWQQYQGKWS